MAELDLDFLASRLGERGVSVAPVALVAASPAAWARYEGLVEQGRGHPWHALMHTLLEGAGVAQVQPLVDWLWSEQPTRNLWRRPIAPMVALARELVAHGVKVGAVSNSEGRLAELLAEIGIADSFGVIADSGRLGIEKPDPRIFAYALRELGAEEGSLAVHIGDLWAADIQGALGADPRWRAIWFGRHAQPTGDPRVAAAPDADAARRALVGWGVLP